jgi:Fuc2NAc and GlcNAc transferase
LIDGSARNVYALLFASGIVAAVGLADDFWGVPIRVRLGVHALAVGTLIWSTPWAVANVDSPWADLPNYIVLTMLFVSSVWLINLFNFMDGIDGIAAAEAVFVLSGIGLLHYGATGMPLLEAVIIACGCAGFLVINWQPAKIFMGDVGSGFIGTAIVACGLYAVAAGVSAWAVSLLASVFVADATVTLSVRVARRLSPFEAHRSHAYQRLARRFNSHAVASTAYSAVNLLWIAPFTYLLTKLEGWVAFVVFLGAIFPLAIAALLLGAGREDEAPQ